MNVQDYAFVSLLATPAVSFMLWEWMQKGHIFELYGNFVNKQDYLNADLNSKIDILKKELQGKLSKEKKEEISEAILFLDGQIQPTPWWKKSLGNCLKCFHVWVFFAFTAAFGLIKFFQSDISFFKYILYHLKEVPIYLILLGISYVILVKLFFK